MRVKILLVAQDAMLRAALARALLSAGYAVELAEGAKRAREVVVADQFDIGIFAMERLGRDDLALARELTEALDDVIVAGMPLDGFDPHGASFDHVEDSADPAAVLARVKAVLERRADGGRSNEPEEFLFEGLTVNLAGHSVLGSAGREIALTRSEFLLLAALARKPGRVLSRDQLRVALTGHGAEAYDRSIDVMVWRLRKKIEADPKAPRFIVTVPGAGYKFAAKPLPISALKAPLGVAIAQSAAASPSETPRDASRDRSAVQSAERRQLTVVSCDLVRLSALSVQVDPEELGALTVTYRQICAEVAARFGGSLAGFSDDGVVLHFGYPIAREDDAERAVSAGIELIKTTTDLRVGGVDAFRACVGVATGVVVVSEGPTQDLVAIGDAPNVAARLRSIAEPGTLLVAASTRRLIGGLFECKELGSIEVKGLAAPIEAWEVLGETKHASRFEAFHSDALTPLVGREEELELLLRLWQRVKGGNGRAVLLSGEPGIGKSRILVALQERLRPPVDHCLRYFCSPHHEGSRLHPVIGQLEHAAGYERDDAPETKFAKLAALLASAASPVEDLVLLAELLSLPVPEGYTTLDLTPQRKREKTFDALLRWLDSLAQREPVLMVFEDAHWSDPTSRELIELVLMRIDRLPVLLVITFRPDFTPPWAGQALTTLTLGRLNRRECTVMVEHVLGNEVLPSDLVDQIVQRTDGVPLFLEELTKAVREADGAAERAASRLAPGRSLDVPATLHASLMARLDRLGPAAKEVAQIAAAIGREFSYDVLSAVTGWPSAELDGALERLVEAGLTFRRGAPPNATFLFKHGLVQDAAYATLLRAKRRQLHARIADILEKLFLQTAEHEPEVLAHHFTEAARPIIALRYWQMAIDKALRTSAYREAISHCLRGLEIAERMEQGADRRREELSLQLQRGAATIASFGPAAPSVPTVFGRAQTVAEELGDDRGLAAALLGLWAHHQAKADLEPAIALAERLVIIGEGRGEEALRVQGHAASLTVSYKMGKFAQAWQHFECGTALYRPDMRVIEAIPNYVNPGPEMLLHGSFVAWATGYPDRARKLAEETMIAARQRDQPYTLTHCVYMLGHLAELQDDWAAVREANERTIELATRWGFAGTVTLVRRRIALVAVAIDRDEEQFHIKCQYRQPGFARSLHDVILARMCRSLSVPERGLLLLDETLALTQQTKSRFYDAEVYRTQGQLLASLQRWAEAEKSFARAIETARIQGARMWELRAATDLARMWVAHDRARQARALLAPVYEWFTEGFDTPDLEAAKRLLDEMPDEPKADRWRSGEGCSGSDAGCGRSRR